MTEIVSYEYVHIYIYINLTENSNSKITSGKKCLNGVYSLEEYFM